MSQQETSYATPTLRWKTEREAAKEGRSTANCLKMATKGRRAWGRLNEISKLRLAKKNTFFLFVLFIKFYFILFLVLGTLVTKRPHDDRGSGESISRQAGEGEHMK